jgi:hypothetical protein
MTTKEREKNEAIERLREWLKPGDVIYCVLRSVSRSGMSRVIDLKKVDENGAMLSLGYNAAIAMGDKYDRDRWGIKIGGCGMDMGFALVYNLGATLWREGYGCTGKDCSSNDHSNGDRDYTPNRNEGVTSDKDGNQREVNTHWHREGGYALKSRWI